MLADRRLRIRWLTGLAAVTAAGVAVVLVLPGGSGSRKQAGTASTARPRPVTAASATSAVPPTAAGPGTSGVSTTSAVPAAHPPATTSPPVRATPPPTVDPGALPQTGQRPGTGDPLFSAHVGDLWRAVVDGRPEEAMPFFFPLRAYVQVKGISDPVHDYQTRLVPDFEQDVQALHDDLGAAFASARLTGVSVPDAAQWILPGVEYNKGSYWRVYGTTVTYTEGGLSRSFSVTSMISWRGEWYVVHLGAIR